MLDQLQSAWRGRRALLVSAPDCTGLFMQAFLEELGARSARIAPDADAESLCRALTAGRTHALILPSLSCLTRKRSLSNSLSALELILSEAREAGVPLVILCAEGAGDGTREGLAASILLTAADGISRGLLGDAVSTILVRHRPCTDDDTRLHLCLSALQLGARYLLGERDVVGTYTLSAAAHRATRLAALPM